jgi:putative ABC transport system ATP-binding protein
MILLQNVVKSYKLGDQEHPVLRSIDLQIDTSELVALVGSSGSGKSTLLGILGCLDRPSSGKYMLLGKDTDALGEAELARLRNLHIGFIFQNFHLMPRATALSNVAHPLIYRGVSRAEREAAAEMALKRVGMSHRLTHKPGELSGGQRQRVAIARALVGAPKLVLADEPTGNLDSVTAGETMDLLCELNGDGVTVVIVTHEWEISNLCKRIIRLQDGRIVD